MLIGRTIAAALVLLAAWSLIALVIAGLGLLVRGRLVSRQTLSGAGVCTAFWLGTATLVLVLQVWHLFAPVGTAAAAAVLVLSGMGLLEHARTIRDWLRRVDRRRMYAAGAALLAAGLWAAHRGTANLANFDSGMYHVPVVEWYKQYPLVPGLANLHGRFGFNNASFLLAALLESGPWRHGSTHLLNGVFVLGFLLHAGVRVASSLGRSVAPGPMVFDLVLTAPVLAMTNHDPMLAGLSPDVPAAIAVFAAFSLLFAAFHGAPADERERGIALVTAVALLAAATAMKLTIGIAAAVAAPIGIWLLWRGLAAERRRRPFVLTAIVLAAGIGVTWLVRGVLHSGYPLYPSTLAGAPVDWRVPVEQARAEYDWIRLFGRYEQDPSSYNRHAWVELLCTPHAWLRSWLAHLKHPSQLWQLPVPLALACVFGLIGFTTDARRRRVRQAWLLAVPQLAAIALWWHIAPRPLFAFWAFWLLAAVAAGQAAGAIPQRKSFLVLAVAGILGVGILPLLGAGLDAARATDESNLAAAASVWFVRPPEHGLFQPTRWSYPVRPYRTQSGLELFVPQGHRCARARLPCTSHPAPNLELRRPGDLRSGFRVNGPWQAERWPNPWADFLRDWREARECRRQ